MAGHGCKNAKMKDLAVFSEASWYIATFDATVAKAVEAMASVKLVITPKSKPGVSATGQPAGNGTGKSTAEPMAKSTVKQVVQ
jgi:hypothetical protein